MPALPSPLLRVATPAVVAAAVLFTPAHARAEEAAAPAAPVAPVLRPALASGPLGTELLSDERTLTRWASARYETEIRRAPSGKSAKVGTLRFMTEDGYPEVYVVLESRVVENSGTWLRIRIPARPNGRAGWVLEDRMGDLSIVTTLLTVRRGRDATLRRAGKVVWTAPIASGATRTPTPAGMFWIREKFPAGGGSYGPYAFGTSAYSVLSDWPRGGVVGIHGTNQPNLVPGTPSHGCIRVKNAAVSKLYKLMPVGTPVLVT